MNVNELTDTELRLMCIDRIAELEADGLWEPAEFFEEYVDPDGPLRYCGGCDASEAINNILAHDPRTIFDGLCAAAKDSQSMWHHGALRPDR